MVRQPQGKCNPKIGNSCTVSSHTAFLCSTVNMKQITLPPPTHRTVAPTLFMRDRSIHRPPLDAAMWPSRLVPVPKGMTGVRVRAQMVTREETSSLLWGKAT